MLGKFTKIMAVCSLSVLAAASCIQGIDDTPTGGTVKTAIRLDVSSITASSAKLDITIAQPEAVASFIVVDPVTTASMNLLAMDAVGRLEAIKNNGREAEVPFSYTFRPLDPGTDYIVAAVALDKEGTVISAPTFSTFTTGVTGVTVGLTTEEDPASGVIYKYNFDCNASSASFNWLYSTEDTYVGMSDDAIKALLVAGKDPVKSSTFNVSSTLKYSDFVNAVAAAVAFDDAGRAGEFKVTRFNASTATAPKVQFADAAYVLEQPNESEQIFVAKNVVLPEKSTFTISFDGATYGFLPMSGNGGIGRIENTVAAFYPGTYTTKPADGADPVRVHYCNQKAIGRMQKISDGGEPFWTNLTASKTATIKVDATDPEKLIYYIEVDNEANIVFWESFDLFCMGGDYLSTAKGSGFSDGTFAANPNIEGTEPGSKDAGAYTGAALDIWSYPASVAPTDGDVANEKYIKNRGLEGWEIYKTASVGGAVRLSKSSSGQAGYVKTPAFTALTGATDVTFELDCFRFGGLKATAAFDGNVILTLEGSGSFTSASANNNAEGVDAWVETKYTPGDGVLEAQKLIINREVCPFKSTNAINTLGLTHITIKIAGASSDTRIKIDATGIATAAQSRLVIDEIKVTK